MDTISNTSNQTHTPRRRRYSPEFKSELIALCKKPCISVAFIGRQYGVNDNLIHRWLKDPKLNPGICLPLIESIQPKHLAGFFELPFKSQSHHTIEQIELDVRIHFLSPHLFKLIHDQTITNRARVTFPSKRPSYRHTNGL